MPIIADGPAALSQEAPILNTLPPDFEPEDLEDDAASGADGEAIVVALGPEHCGIRFDKALAALVPQFSRSRIQQWLEAGLITIDDVPVRAKAIASGDETVLIRPQAAPEDQAFTPQEMELAIVHQDKALVVIDKPAGLVVHPAAGNWSGTLLNGLLFRFPELAQVPRAGIVHRLDKDTSGLMVVARTIEAQTDLVRQLQARSVGREYLALVWGAPQITGRVDAPIGRHARERVKMAVTSHASAKPAVTHYERLGTGTLDGKPVSLLRCRLETGRTHQIRVHMQSIGFPLVGDTLYGKTHLASAFPRQALHAQRLALVHPASGKDKAWAAPLPQDMQDLLRAAGIDVGLAA